MRILFYDGDLQTHNPESYIFLTSIIGKQGDCKGKVYIIDAGLGPTRNRKDLDELLHRVPGATIITNSVVALNHYYGWEYKENHTNIFLWDEKESDFIRIDCLTDKDIREAHNIEKMYLAGAFKND